MRLTEEQAEKILKEYQRLAYRLRYLPLELLSSVSPKLKSERAREYLSHGIGRRLGVMSRCLDNVFSIFPPGRSNLLQRAELADIQINLHAFVINVYGLLDNVAWMYVCERGMENQIKGGRAGVGLFSKNTQRHLPESLVAYLNSDNIKAWYSDYAKNYRDALAHRIPLYVPPFTLIRKNAGRYRELDSEIWERIRSHDFDLVERLTEEKEALGIVCAAFTHSYSDTDASRPVLLHAQIICDALTVEELLSKVSAHITG